MGETIEQVDHKGGRGREGSHLALCQSHVFSRQWLQEELFKLGSLAHIASQDIHVQALETLKNLVGPLTPLSCLGCCTPGKQAWRAAALFSRPQGSFLEASQVSRGCANFFSRWCVCFYIMCEKVCVDLGAQMQCALIIKLLGKLERDI